MPDSSKLLETAAAGFASLEVGRQHQQKALLHLEQWLTGGAFVEYVPQIVHLIEDEHWDYLLDSFYQVIPFGTGGRRGEVGIGPNRINRWTIQASAQGHSQYLLKEFGEEAKSRGVVFAYDVREFAGNQFFDSQLPNPVQNLKCKDLALAAAEVYAANGVTVHLFDGIRTTPELSFAVRHLKAAGGDVFSASHNPPEHNGKKIYDQFGGQLVPPEDEALVEEVTQRVKQIKTLPFDQALEKGLIKMLDKSVDQAYLKAAGSVSLSNARGIKVGYTPLHGCGGTSVLRVLKNLRFAVQEDPATSNPSGAFEHVTFNIPNPEVPESFETSLKFARKEKLDILLSSDPDADRLGVAARHGAEWRIFDGNEIASILAEYAIAKRKPQVTGRGVIIKTAVTTDLLREICAQNDVELIGDLLVGYKYIGREMNTLEKAGRISELLMSCEESHGYFGGDYARDKDAVTPAVWLSELAAELKEEGRTLVDYLDAIHEKYGFYRNYMTEIRMLGAEGNEKIHRIQEALRADHPRSLGRFRVKDTYDFRTRTPIVSGTDNDAKNLLMFTIDPEPGTTSIKIFIRPSGTEPKTKMYFEIGMPPVSANDLENVRAKATELLSELEKAFLLTCYDIIDVDFPDRGFLLFNQLPLDAKLRYFELEPEIAKLKDESGNRRAKAESLLRFLGSDPFEKVDGAFSEKYGSDIKSYLDL